MSRSHEVGTAASLGGVLGFLAPFGEFLSRVGSAVVTTLTVAAILGTWNWIRDRIARSRKERT